MGATAESVTSSRRSQLNDIADVFQKIASGVQSVVVAIAVVIGGLWTYYTFNAQLQVQNAEATLEKLNRDLVQEPSPDIQIELDKPSRRQGITYLLGRLRIKNTGTGSVVIEAYSGSVKLSLVTGIETFPPVFTQ